MEHQSTPVTKNKINASEIINDGISQRLERVLYLMIDAYFGYENKFQEMIKMINKTTSNETKNEWETYQKALNTI